MVPRLFDKICELLPVLGCQPAHFEIVFVCNVHVDECSERNEKNDDKMAELSVCEVRVNEQRTRESQLQVNVNNPTPEETAHDWGL